jgi:hypothetical protein
MAISIPHSDIQATRRPPDNYSAWQRNIERPPEFSSDKVAGESP